MLLSIIIINAILSGISTFFCLKSVEYFERKVTLKDLIKSIGLSIIPILNLIMVVMFVLEYLDDIDILNVVLWECSNNTSGKE